MLPDIDRLATVVVCEDDEVTRELLCENLAADRYEPVAAGSAEEALRHCRYRAPDLLLLDLLLPDASGLDVLREIRAGDGSTARWDPALAVIVISGRGSETDRVRGLGAGADDYLVKPFHYPELELRIRRLLARRRRGVGEGPRRIGELFVDPAARTVRIGEREVDLANKEYEFLLALSAEPTRVFTKAELLRDVWGYRTLGRTRTLDSHASRLRRKLDPERGRWVVNTWGVPQRYLLRPIIISSARRPAHHPPRGRRRGPSGRL